MCKKGSREALSTVAANTDDGCQMNPLKFQWDFDIYASVGTAVTCRYRHRLYYKASSLELFKFIVYILSEILFKNYPITYNLLLRAEKWTRSYVLNYQMGSTDFPKGFVVLAVEYLRRQSKDIS